MKPKIRTAASRKTAGVSAPPAALPPIEPSRRDLRVARRIGLAFGCLPVLPAKTQR